MTLVLALGLLVLAAAVVVLFAMFGELAARTPDPAGRDRLVIRPLPDVRVGHSPSAWPEGLARLVQRDSALLLVLSTACASCEQVAAQLVQAAEAADSGDLGLVVSCGTAAAGRDFVAGHRLGGYPHVVDEGGRWVREEFGVDRSPSALAVRAGLVHTAVGFTDLPTLRATVGGRSDRRAAAQ